MRRQTKLNINLKEYQNKSRKGLYIVIKQENKPQRLYKYHGNYGEIDATKKYYEDKYIKQKPLAKSQRTYRQAYEKAIKKEPEKNKERIRIRQQAQAYIRRIRKTGSIEAKIQTGTAKINIEKANHQTPSTINTKIKQLLGQLIMDKNIIEIMSQNDNLEKIKHRFEYKIRITGEQGETLMEFNKFNTTPNKAITEIKQATEEGETIQKGSGQGKTRRQFKNLRWNEIGVESREGKIKQANLTITLRK